MLVAETSKEQARLQQMRDRPRLAAEIPDQRQASKIRSVATLCKKNLA